MSPGTKNLKRAYRRHCINEKVYYEMRGLTAPKVGLKTYALWQTNDVNMPLFKEAKSWQFQKMSVWQFKKRAA